MGDETGYHHAEIPEFGITIDSAKAELTSDFLSDVKELLKKTRQVEKA